ncbi:acetyltransferas-like protein [Setomelanomma holmii]|uniref:Acetyltransferas-like protein n=1 Tax=Setomelanomma holmii TaxID=210430 RepID=A0A9P4LTI9_9PLEO|nr:acetyltransferas-like protein [Setomelanomma holmii]
MHHPNIQHRSSIRPSITFWIIEPVPFERKHEVVAFINDPFGPGRYFLEARDGTRLIAAIGYVPYNHRFPQFKYHDLHTVEVVRLYLLPEYRRRGLAAALFSTLYQRAHATGIQRLYLHTHPCLPGAVKSWRKHGFEIVQVEDDPTWRTTHMELPLKRLNGNLEV